MFELSATIMLKLTKIDIRNIDLIVYDFDGVLTDNRVLLSQDGKESVFCNRSDGLTIGWLRRLNVRQIILSTEENPVVARRAQKLKIPAIHGVADKRSALTNYAAKHRLNLKKTVYIGNDLNDLEVMRVVGYPLAPQDAAAGIKKIARAVIPVKGGYGVVRELWENFLKH